MPCNIRTPGPPVNIYTKPSKETTRRLSSPAEERQTDPGHDETPVSVRAPTALCKQRLIIPADGPLGFKKPDGTGPLLRRSE